jgi:hypothetical protein
VARGGERVRASCGRCVGVGARLLAMPRRHDEWMTDVLLGGGGGGGAVSGGDALKLLCLLHLAHT